jgi:ribonuclease HI
MNYLITFDGGAIPNPGKGYGSYAITDDFGRVHSVRCNLSHDIAPLTNNQAEYLTLIEAMHDLFEIDQDWDELTIIGDSKLVLNQVTDAWECSDRLLSHLANAIHELQNGRPITAVWHPRAVSVRIFGH